MTDAPMLEIVRAGLHTTVQDLGRWGRQSIGVPAGGAMDPWSLRRANVLVGNAEGEAALEVTLTGCAVRPTTPVHLAVTGAVFDLTVNGTRVGMHCAIAVQPGETLSLGARHAGARAYLAVRGGLDAPILLGSRSAWPMHPRRGALHDGDRVTIGRRIAGPVRAAMRRWPVFSEALRVLRGPETSTAAAGAFDSLCHAMYRLSAASSRMAYPLEGPPVTLVMPDRASAGTVPGAVQILPSGQPILLMADRQTTGGYPVAAVVITADLGHAAQLAPGGTVSFVACTHEEAGHALERMEQAWQPGVSG